MKSLFSLVCLMMLLVPSSASAEWQIRPFFGGTFAADTTFVDPEQAAGDLKFAFGGNAQWLGKVFGLDIDGGYTPAFFQSDDILVLQSGVTTLTAGLVVAVPRHLTQYTLRPYFVVGGGMMHVNIEGSLALPIAESSRPAMNIGGGATGFVSRHVGFSWEVRHFRTIGTGEVRGQSVGPEALSFWRVSMAVAIRP